MRFIQSVKERIMRNGLPDGYTRLEYLQSTGTQYIDTGYVMTSGHSSTFSGNIMWTDKNSSANFFYGYRSVNSATYQGDMRAFFIYGGTATPIGRLAIRYGVNTDNSTSAGVSLNTKCNISWDGLDLKVNGTTYATLTDAYTPANYQSMWLFWCNCTGYYSAGVGHFIGRIYNWQIKDDGIIVRDFVPALDSNNKPCMYDLITKQPYYNQASGDDFSYGKQLTPVKYIESTGTQYIDTGIQPTDDYGYRIINTYTAGQGEQCAIGCMDSGNRFVGVYTSGSANAISGAWGSFVNFLPSYPWTTGTILDVKCNYKNSRKMIIDNTEMKDISDIHITGTISNSIYIGARNYGSTVTKMQGKIYSVEITKGQEVIANYIPVRDENNVGYMLDLLTNALYANAGSGSFTIGEDDILIRNIGKTKFFKQTTRKLPKGFQEVEYLESTGTQYIDIGLKGKNNLDFKYKCEFTNLDGTAQCVGGNWSGQDSSTVSMYFGLIRTNGNFAYHYDGTSSPVVVMNTTTQGTPYSIQGHLWKGEQYFIINGTKSSVGTITSEFTSPLNMYLFGINNNGLANPAYIKLHCFKLWDNGVLVRDFVPYLDANGRPCMWDTVEGKPYYNQGSGEFNYGRKIIPVEYLESTGTQYIDTGLDYFADFEVGIKLRQSVANKVLGNGALYCLQRYNASNPYWYFSTGTGTRNSYITSTPITEHHVMKWKDNKIYADDVLLTEFTKSLNTSNRMYLFSADGSNKYPNMIYFCKLWNPDDGTLVRDYIPCIDENNVPFMFDKVTHSAFLNAGTGNFLYGNPVGQRTETLRVLPIIRHLPLNYLESTGTQYINTGLLSTANSKVDTTFSFTSMESGVANNCAIFGGRNVPNVGYETFTFFKLASTTPQQFRFDYNGQATTGTANQMTWDTTSKYRFQYDGSNWTTTNTTTSQSVTDILSPASSFTAKTIYIFALNNAGSVSNNMQGRIYHYWYTDGTNTIDLYPVLKLPERIPCMYDKVSRTYFYNEGTDPFLYG